MARSKRKQFAGLSGSVMQPIDDLSLLLPIGYSLNSRNFRRRLKIAEIGFSKCGCRKCRSSPGNSA